MTGPYRDHDIQREEEMRSMEKRRKRIGLMGGTFDPVHIGHLILGEAAWRQFALDEVWYMPAGNPPHKRDRAGRASDEQRVEMLRLAIESNPHFSLSMIEMNEDGYSYTYRTLERLREREPEVDWYFIMGADSLTDFDTWREPQRIADACHIVVATRNRMDTDSFEELLEKRRREYGDVFLRLDTPNLDVSSAHLREMIKNTESVRYYVPDPVLYYIHREGLYD